MGLTAVISIAEDLAAYCMIAFRHFAAYLMLGVADSFLLVLKMWRFLQFQERNLNEKYISGLDFIA